MKIVDYLEDLLESNSLDDNNELSGEMLKAVKHFLPQLEEFKDVEKINILPTPVYTTDKYGDLLNCAVPSLIYNDDDKVVKVEQTVTFKLGEGIKFNSIVDIYALSLTPPIYKLPHAYELGRGVHVSPLIYDPKTFTPLRELRIIFSPELAQDVNRCYTDEDVTKKFKDEVLEAIDKMISGELTTTYEGKRNVLVRCSRRSYTSTN